MKQYPKKHEILKMIAISVLIGITIAIPIWRIFHIMQVSDTYYPSILSGYKEKYMRSNGTDLGKLWVITKDYTKKFHNMWDGKLNACLVRPKYRGIVMTLGDILVDHLNPKQYDRFLVVVHYGCCEEYSESLTELLEDISHVKTRIVYLKGKNIGHAVPEVWYNGSWYVFDALWTLSGSDKPIPIKDYYSYLKQHNFTNLCCNTTEIEYNFEDFKKEHGFPDEPDPDKCGKNK